MYRAPEYRYKFAFYTFYRAPVGIKQDFLSFVQPGQSFFVVAGVFYFSPLNLRIFRIDPYIPVIAVFCPVKR